MYVPSLVLQLKHIVTALKALKDAKEKQNEGKQTVLPIFNVVSLGKKLNNINE